MKSYKFLLIAFLIIAFPISIAHAENSYIGIQAGAAMLNDGDITQSGIAIDTEYETGYLIGITFGSNFDKVRLEGEFTYRNNSVDKVTAFGVSPPVDGDVSSASFMVNGYYDIKSSSSVTPYIGAGIGFSQVSINDLKINGIDVADDDDVVFAYQFAVGLGFDFTQSTTLDIGYKYFATADPSFSDVAGSSFDAEYSSHNLSLGVRFKF